MKSNSIIYFFVILTGSLLGILVQTSSAQQEENITKREVISDDFTKNRPVAKSKSISVPKTSVPQRVFKGKKVIRAKPKKVQKPASLPPTTMVNPLINHQLGITMWKLRPEQKTDIGARLLTMHSSSKFVAERVSLETVFQPNDRVRLSIESPSTGYLYVIDREINNAGVVGDAYLIFPTLRTRNGNNQVGSGTVIEIPAQSDDPSYFEITPTTKDYGGEMLTVIISPVRLPDLVLGDEPLKISAQIFSDWQDKWEEDANLLELKDGEKIQYTESEKNAGQGGSQLNQEDLPPQTYFEIKAPQGRAFMINFPMKVISNN